MRLAITGMGLMTSVGHDLATACASIAAGTQRPHEVWHYSQLDFEEQDSKPLIARPVHGCSDGFVGVGLWLRLLIAAAEDMTRAPGIPPATDAGFWARTALCVVTPELTTDRYNEDETLVAGRLPSILVEPLLDAVGWTIPVAHRYVLPAGHVGAIQAIAGAERLIAAGSVDRLVIACVDSYLDPLSLDWLDEAERLKAEDHPFGVIPGEAGACFMLESAESVAQRRVAPNAYVAACHVAAGTGRPLSDDPVTGQSLALAMRETLDGLGIPTFSGPAIVDLNGETWRAQDWGSARVRLGTRLSDDVQWIFPADSLGETGAASAGVAVCLAAAALQRNQREFDAVLIGATSESGVSACAGLRPAGA